MKQNDNQAFYEIIYDYYLICQKNKEIKMASKLAIKNIVFQVIKKKGLSEKTIKKYGFLELMNEKLLEPDWKFLAESLKLHIHVYHLNSKGEITTFNYKENNSVDKPFHIKILQKEGKFYGLFNANQKLELDNLIFEEKNDIKEKDGKDFTPIPKNSDSKISEIINPDNFQNEIKFSRMEVKNDEVSKPEEKTESKIEIKCCICHNLIVNSQYFINPSCKHIY